MTTDTPESAGWNASTPEPSRTTDDKLDARIDKALAKYVFVWVWSVLFGTATGAALTYANYRPFGKYRAADFLFGVLLVLGGIFTLLSVYNLYRFLMRFLLPMFRQGATVDLEKGGYQLLSGAVRNLLLAFALGLFLVFLQFLIGGLGD